MLIIATNAAAMPSDVVSWAKAEFELPELPETELECSNVIIIMHTSPAPEVTRSARHRPRLGHLHH